MPDLATGSTTGGEIGSLSELVKTLGLKTPTSEQAKVATYPPTINVAGEDLPAPLLVVAGAGSGKTETLSLRATFMAAHYNVPADSILGLTFTRKAAGELQQRLRERLETLQRSATGAPRGRGALVLSGGAEAMTYNAFALGVVREFGARIGIDPQVTHMGEAAAWELMEEVVQLWSGELPESMKQAATVEKALELRQDIANQGMTLGEVRRGIEKMLKEFEAANNSKVNGLKVPFIQFHRQGQEALEKRLSLLDVIQRFEDEMLSLGRMDYTQQVLAAIRVVEEVEEARAALRERHKVVFLDEFQDTSVAQMRFLSRLFGNHPVTAVGDPNQAIYGWRGASAASLSDFHSRFNTDKRVPNETLTLSTAWRNDTLILDVANKVAEPLRGRPTWVPHIAGKAGQGDEQIALPKLDPRPGAAAGLVEAVYTQAERDSLDALVNYISKTKEKLKRALGREPSVAVLSRRTVPLVHAVEALQAAGIPAQLAAGDALLASPAVMDLRAALEIVADVGKSSQLLRLLTDLHLGATDLRALGNLSRTLARPRDQENGERTELLLEAVEAITGGGECPDLSEPGRHRIQGLGKRLAAAAEFRDSGLVEQVEGIRWAMGIDSEFMADPTSPGTGELLDQFTALAVEYEAATDHPRLGSFLRWLDYVESKEQGLRVPSVQMEPGAVQAMTVHSAKGLEWDIVAVIDMEDSKFPSSGRRGKDPEKGPYSPFDMPTPQPDNGWWTNPGMLPYPLREDHQHLPGMDVFVPGETGTAMKDGFREDMGEYRLSEERRLAYVAFTRARSHLYLSGAWNLGGRTVLGPSPFMLEAIEPPGVDSDLMDSPSGQAWEEIAESTDHAVFPPGPSALERQGEQAAAQVQEARAEILGRAGTGATADIPNPAEGIVDEVLAGISDQGLARRARLLLEEHRQRNRAEDPMSMSPQEAIEAIGAIRSLQVTEVARLESDPVHSTRDLVRPMPGEPTTGALTGTAFHAWIEATLRQAGVTPSEVFEEEEMAVELHALTPTDRQFLEQLQSAFEESGFLDAYTAQALEIPFSTISAGITIRGRIDAVLEDSSGTTWLVDWKTRRSLPKSFSLETLLYYRSQLQHYLDAWTTRVEGSDQVVRAALVFVAPQGVQKMTLEQIDAALEETALEQAGKSP